MAFSSPVLQFCVFQVEPTRRDSSVDQSTYEPATDRQFVTRQERSLATEALKLVAWGQLMQLVFPIMYRRFSNHH